MNRRHALLAIAVSFVFCGSVFAPVLFAGKILAVGDGLIEALPAFFGPWHLWNPNLMLGYPLYADPSQAAFYPLRLLRFIPGGFNLYIVSSFAIAGAALFGYVFDLARDRLAAFAAAVSFTFGGFMIPHFGHPMIDHPAAWTLVALWTLGRYRRTRRVHWLAGTTVAMALSLSSGQPQIILFAFVILTAHTLVGELPRAIGLRSWSSLAGAIAPLAAIALGLGLGAAFYLPAIGLGEASTRVTLSFPDFVEFSIPPNFIPLFLTFPYVTSGVLPGFSGALIAVPGGSFTETSIFVSAAAIALACAGLAGRPRPLALFWASVAIGGFALAVGDALLPLAAWTYTLPPFNAFRIPGRHGYEITLALSILAGLGVTALRARPFRWPMATGLVIMVLLYAGATYDVYSQNPQIVTESVVTWFLAAALGQLILLIAALRTGGHIAARCAALAIVGGTVLFASLSNWRNASSLSVLDTPPYVRALRSLPLGTGQREYAYSTDPNSNLRPNLPALWNVPDVAGYTPLQFRDVRRFLNTSPSGGLLDIAAPSTDLSAIRYVAVPAEPEPTLSDDEPFGAADLGIFLSSAGARSTALGFAKAKMGDRIEIVSALGESIETVQGTVVATVIARSDDGETQRYFLRAGVDTAEIAYDRPGVAKRMRHRRPSVYSQPASITWFATTLPLRHRTAIRSLLLTVSRATTAFNLLKVSVVDGKTHLAFPLSQESELFADQKHFRHVEDVGGVAIFENLRARPRAWLDSGSPEERRKDEAVDSIFLSELDPETHRADVTCRSRCTFVSSDQMNHGWRATVDNIPAPLGSSHGVLAALRLEKGHHEITLSYVPSTLYKGIAISAASCVLAILLFGVTPLVRQRVTRQS